MKSSPQNSQLRFNLYLSASQNQKLRRLLDVGLTISAIARQSIRKCGDMNLEPEGNGPYPTRYNLYLDPSDAESLTAIAERENYPKAEALRRLIDTYLHINADAIDRLF